MKKELIEFLILLSLVGIADLLIFLTGKNDCKLIYAVLLIFPTIYFLIVVGGNILDNLKYSISLRALKKQLDNDFREFETNEICYEIFKKYGIDLMWFKFCLKISDSEEIVIRITERDSNKIIKEVVTKDYFRVRKMFIKK